MFIGLPQFLLVAHLLQGETLQNLVLIQVDQGHLVELLEVPLQREQGDFVLQMLLELGRDVYFIDRGLQETFYDLSNGGTDVFLPGETSVFILEVLVQECLDTPRLEVVAFQSLFQLVYLFLCH